MEGASGPVLLPNWNAARIREPIPELSKAPGRGGHRDGAVQGSKPLMVALLNLLWELFSFVINPLDCVGMSSIACFRNSGEGHHRCWPQGRPVGAQVPSLQSVLSLAEALFVGPLGGFRKPRTELGISTRSHGAAVFSICLRQSNAAALHLVGYGGDGAVQKPLAGTLQAVRRHKPFRVQIPILCLETCPRHELASPERATCPCLSAI